ncbi:hypothetical protein BY996DRAFT_6533748 [Phakopsora pachyrhizi]|nr:hypothetical protein BY996DRAFT_6533748 [Phakopsora pachyrhizi]
MRAKYPIVLGQMEEISAEAKLLIGLCYEICFLVKELRQLVATVCGLRELLRFVYHLAGFRLCRLLSVQRRCHCDQIGWKRILVRRTDLPIKDARQWRGKQMRLVMTSNGTEMTEWEEGPDQGSDQKSSMPCGTIRRALALGCLIDCQPRWMAELRIQKAAIRDWRPADRLEELAEEEGEENLQVR